jgi:hypothetical protein
VVAGTVQRQQSPDLNQSREDGSFQTLDAVPFGRSRLLALVGGAVFGLATRIVAPDPAYAAHDYSAIWPCAGYGICHCCSGTWCCGFYCDPGYEHGHCSSGGQCWYTCGCFQMYQCCDWHVFGTNQQQHCICKAIVSDCGSCGG